MDVMADLRWRGLVHQVTSEELGGLLEERLTVYCGFDPTSDSLHVGNLVQQLVLRRLQLAGHRPIVLAGGGTGPIGDPSGRAGGERALLTEAELAHNISRVRAQLERILDFTPGPTQAVLADNAEWLEPIPLVRFLRDVGKHFTVNAMIAKESVRARLQDREQGISYTEFSYMLLQAFDFQQLYDRFGCRLQIGGSDQWGNITAGIDLIRRTRQAEAFGLTTPLITRADGRKYGKSEGAETPWLAPDRMSPYRLYQYWMNLPDAEVPQALRMFTFLSHEEIEALEAETVAHPERRAAQRVLAWELSTLVHGEECARQAQHASEVLFSPEVAGLDEATLLDVFAEAPSTDLSRGVLDGAGHDMSDLLVATGLSPSRGGARRDLAGGGISLNNRRLDAEPAPLTGADLLHGKYALLRKGRKNWHLVRFLD